MLSDEKMKQLIPEAQKLALAVVENNMCPIEFTFVKDNLQVVFHVEVNFTNAMPNGSLLDSTLAS